MSRVPRTPAMPGDWVTLRVALPQEQTQLLCAVFEAADNLAIVRTPDPKRGEVVIYTHDSNRAEVDRILLALNVDFPLEIVAAEPGMNGLEELWA